MPSSVRGCGPIWRTPSTKRSFLADPRKRLAKMLRTAIAAVRADRLTAAALRGREFDYVIALGKAAEALAAGAWRALGPRLVGGFLSCPRGYETGDLPPPAPFGRYPGGHPLPDASSLVAGEALAEFAVALPPGARVAVLLSGGASSGVELPAPGVSLDLLRRANRWLSASALPIEAVNRVRSRLSRLKGGGLARLLAHCDSEAWVLCDVPGGNLAAVAGGPLSPLPGRLPAVPGWLEPYLHASSTAGNGGMTALRRLAGNEEAVAAVVQAGAREAGRLAGEATALGREIGTALAKAAPGFYVWGGEPVVRLPPGSGRGGRCQQLALAAAQVFAGRADCWLLAAGTDGWDGTSAVAGACVDGRTVDRGRAAGRDAIAALHKADAGEFLAASGDLVRTGPTGTNVNDLVITFKIDS